MDPLKTDGKKINENEDDICTLQLLVYILKRDFVRPFMFYEMHFLNEFSTIERLPLQGELNPRSIIEYMLRIHRDCSDAIKKNPGLLKTFVYKYNSGGEEEEYVFSNNMTFYADVITICCLYYIVYRNESNPQEVPNIMVLMKEKYSISHIKPYRDPRVITVHKIALSYPSIFLSLIHHQEIRQQGNILSSCNIFPEPSNLFLLPWLASIIPTLCDYKTPLALLLAMQVILDKNNKPCYVLYQRILTLHFSEVFPNSLKLALCEKWGIVNVTGNEYKYANYFTILRENAIDLIKTSKSNDPSLEYTLSKI